MKEAKIKSVMNNSWMKKSQMGMSLLLLMALCFSALPNRAASAHGKQNTKQGGKVSSALQQRAGGEERFRPGRHLYTAGGYREVMRLRFAAWGEVNCAGAAA